jgi:hypothetical protein
MLTECLVSAAEYDYEALPCGHLRSFLTHPQSTYHAANMFSIKAAADVYRGVTSCATVGQSPEIRHVERERMWRCRV